MKASELRIGNIIKDDRKAKDWRFASHRIISDMASNPNTELYHPIPLTEEWLLKFGFEHLGNPYWLGIDGVIYIGSNGNVELQFFPGDKAVKTRLKIHYVHQLQNLYFALTGIELEI